MSKKLFDRSKLTSPLSLVAAVFILLAIPVTVYTVLRSDDTAKDPEAATGFPSGFSEQNVVPSGLASPTAMEFAPDGRLFVAQQGGALRVIKNDVLLTTPALTLSVDANNERGLLGIAFDPSFATNNFIYLYYTVPGSPPHNRVSRFTMNGDTTSTSTQQILLELDDVSNSNHNGGAIHFGKDGKLYIAVGEDAVRANAQTLANLKGKMLRINSDGSIPTDNPFYTSATGKNRAIWAMGLRNPFTFSIQPGTGRMLINDVGEGTWEEINDGIAGANYGWGGGCEGPCTNPAYRNPIYAYNHTATSTCAITGGTFYNPQTNLFPASYVGTYFFADYCSGKIYRIDPNAPPASSAATTFATQIGSPVDFKVSNSGALYYLYRNPGAVKKVIYGTVPKPPGNYVWCETEKAALSSDGFMVKANSSGASAGSYIYSTVNDVDSTSPPTNTGTANLTFTVPQTGTYTFWSLVNYDFGGADTNSYWVKFDDGTFFKVGNENGSTGWHWINLANGDTTANVITKNLTAGAHSLQIIGRESNTWIDKILLTTTSYVPSGHEDADNCGSVSSNTPPVATITTPTSTQMYNFGDTINFSGTGTDAEDGTLAANAFTWEIILWHYDGLAHPHPHLTIPTSPGQPSSKTGSFITNFTEPSANTYYIVKLTVKDSQGATNSKEVIVNPRKVNITLGSNPVGLKIDLDTNLDGTNPFTTPYTFTGVINYPRVVNAASPQPLAGKSYQFSTWSDGGAKSHTINTPATNTTYTATYQEVAQTVTLTLRNNPATGPYSVIATTSVTGDIKIIFSEGSTVIRNEGDAPYEMFGDGVNSNLGPGAHTIVARVYAQSDTTNTTVLASGQIVVTEPASKPGDLNGDNKVGSNDLLILVGTWGSTTDLRADLNGDNVIDTKDLLRLISLWGS